MSRAASRCSWALALTSVFACGAPERPAPASDTPDSGFATETERRDGSAPAHVCEPGSSHACNVYWTDQQGQQHCTDAFELCRPDGTGWTACGEYER